MQTHCSLRTCCLVCPNMRHFHKICKDLCGGTTDGTGQDRKTNQRTQLKEGVKTPLSSCMKISTVLHT